MKDEVGMTTGRMRRSSSQLKKRRQKRVSHQKLGAGRALRLESLEDRRLLTLGPQLIGVQPNRGDLLMEGDIRNVAPEELRFRFNEGQVIDEATLGAILVTRAGGDGQFSTATARTDFNTNGQVVMQFEAVAAGPLGNDISLVFSKSDPGGARLPRVSVEGREIYIELNANTTFRSTAADLMLAINSDAAASKLVKPTLVSGLANTQIATPAITYSPVRLTGANVAQASTNFSAGNVEVAFTAVQAGPEANGITIEFTRVDRGGAADPRIQVLDSRRIRVELNSNVGNQTTAGQLVSAFNADPAAAAIAKATLRVGRRPGTLRLRRPTVIRRWCSRGPTTRSWRLGMWGWAARRRKSSSVSQSDYRTICIGSTSRAPERILCGTVPGLLWAIPRTTTSTTAWISRCVSNWIWGRKFWR
jgi:hypothetical protein